MHNEINLMQAHGYISTKKIEKAERILDKIDKDFKKNHPYYLELMGDIERENGAVEQAKKYWQQSLQLGNNTKRLLNKLKSN